VKLSDEDLHWLLGEGSLEDLSREVLAMGPRVLFLTAGADGAHTFCGAGTFHAAARQVTVVDTVGAGDTFNAAVLQALGDHGALSRTGIAALATPSAQNEATLRAALTLGNAAAAITVSRRGANPPHRRDLP